jgi:Trypsin-like peptidase domain
MAIRTLALIGLGLVAIDAVAQNATPEAAPAAPPAATLGVARSRAASIDLAARVQKRLDALPADVKQDLVSAFASQKATVTAERKKASDVFKARPSTAARAKLDSITSRFAAINEDSLFVNSIVENGNTAATPAAAPAVPPSAPPLTYNPEYILPTLNPTFAVCGDGVWSRPGFVYQSHVDKNAASLKQMSLSVGLFKSYTQKHVSGLPGLTDLILPAAGTGIAIGPSLVLTNQHVVANMVVDTSAPPASWQLNSAHQRFIIWFPVVTSACTAATQSAPFEVVQIAYVGQGPDHDDDIAVLKVQPLGAGTLQPLTFPDSASYSGEQYLGVIGYPDRPDPTDYVPPTGNGLFPNDAQLEAYFDLPNSQLPKYQIERFGFGTLVDLGDPDKRIIGHDAPTDNSSSGSLVVALDTGRPIGLHAGGRLGAGRNAGVNIAYRGDYIMAQLRAHGVLGSP